MFHCAKCGTEIEDITPLGLDHYLIQCPKCGYTKHDTLEPSPPSRRIL